jgi:hypothetical protein
VRCRSSNRFARIERAFIESSTRGCLLPRTRARKIVMHHFAHFGLACTDPLVLCYVSGPMELDSSGSSCLSTSSNQTMHFSKVSSHLHDAVALAVKTSFTNIENVFDSRACSAVYQTSFHFMYSAVVSQTHPLSRPSVHLSCFSKGISKWSNQT